MLLHFEGGDEDFILYGGKEEFENEWANGLRRVGCFSIVYVNQKGEVVYLSVEAPFGPDCILEMVKWVKQNPPPGLYTVPELGLKDVSFYKVLMEAYKRVKAEWDKFSKMNSNQIKPTQQK
jgi:hypothetical protein